MSPVSDRRGSIISSITAIVAAGAVAAVGAWLIVTGLALTGVTAAVVAVLVAMVLGVSVFALGVRIFARHPKK